MGGGRQFHADVPVTVIMVWGLHKWTLIGGFEVFFCYSQREYCRACYAEWSVQMSKWLSCMAIHKA